MKISTIESIWSALKAHGPDECQQRVDARHPHDIYLCVTPEGRIGLLALCNSMPPESRGFKAVAIERRQRTDQKWALQLELLDNQLSGVFSALCSDIIEMTRTVRRSEVLGATILGRMERWRHLLEEGLSPLGEHQLRGLAAELVVLERLLDCMQSPGEVVKSWVGPLGLPQDFVLPSGGRLEVKAIAPNAATVEIANLAQLDVDYGPLSLVTVSLLNCGSGAEGAFALSDLVERLRARLEVDPEASEAFDLRLAASGWQDQEAIAEDSLRIIRIEAYEVDDGFPRLTRRTVPAGVDKARYVIVLPSDKRSSWTPR